MPNKKSIIAATRQYKLEGLEAFLDKYASGRKPKAHFLLYKDELFPLKAIWSASHNPPIHNRDFQTGEATRGVKRLGFETIVQGEAAKQYLEGEMRRREASYFARNQKLAEDAKKHFSYVCQGCKFEFSKFYGTVGNGYIECHHIDPISQRGGKTEPKTLDDVTVLCANCHRMVHRDRSASLSMDELRQAIESAKNSN